MDRLAASLAQVPLFAVALFVAVPAVPFDDLETTSDAVQFLGKSGISDVVQAHPLLRLNPYARQ